MSESSIEELSKKIKELEKRLIELERQLNIHITHNSRRNTNYPNNRRLNIEEGIKIWHILK